jgi:hypothetical protein
MRLEGVVIGFQARIISRYPIREGVESKGDVVAGIVVGRPDASDHPVSFKC